MTATERNPLSEILLPASKFLLIDLDKTLIDGSYKITDPDILYEIQRVQGLGWTIGISSDTPVEPLRSIWMKKFGFNGPILAEKGAVAVFPSGKEIVAVPDSVKPFSKELRLRLVEMLAKEGIGFFHCEVGQFIRSQPKFPEAVGSKLVFVQSKRRFSFNYYGKVVSPDGNLSIDNELTLLIRRMIDPLIGRNPPFEIDEDFNPDYGICILSAKQTNKRLGTIQLMKELGITSIGMVGDSLSDYIGDDIAYHYAVGNAKNEFSQKANFTAMCSFTSGVKEVLSKIK